MQRIKTLHQRAEFRLLIVLAVAAVLATPFIPSHIKLAVAYYAGVFLIPLLVSAVVAYIAYDRRVFFIVAAISFIAILLLNGLHILDLSPPALASKPWSLGEMR
jgi:hypothetical protein